MIQITACYEKNHAAGIASYHTGEIIAANERARKLIHEYPKIAWVLATPSFRKNLVTGQTERTLQEIILEAQLETKTVFCFHLSTMDNN